MEEQNENKPSFKDIIKLSAWVIYLGGVVVQTFYGYFFDPIMKYKSFAYNLGRGLLWFTVIPILKEALGLLILGVVIFFLYSSNDDDRKRR